MAKFKYLGEVHGRAARLGLRAIKIRFHNQDGSWTEIEAADKVHGFSIGEVINLDHKDARVLRHLRIDPRFKEIKELEHGYVFSTYVQRRQLCQADP